MSSQPVGISDGVAKTVVEGKIYGRGLFISVNGFLPDSVQALTTGKGTWDYFGR